MSNRMSFRNGTQSHPYFSSHSPLNPTDSGHMFGSTRDMAPPPLMEFPPRPMEIDLNSSSLNMNSSRTLPNPSASAPAAWDSVLFQNQHFGDSSYGNSIVNKAQHIPADGHNRAPTQNPLVQWYTGNDGPWIPKQIVATNERSQLRYTGNQNSARYGSQGGPHRQSSTAEGGAPCSYEVPASDSGYGTRQSVGNTSVFNGEMTERDHESHSLLGPSEYSSYQSYSEPITSQSRLPQSTDAWAAPLSSPSQNSPLLVCPTCEKPVKTQSELKKHDLRHRKPFLCKVKDCTRTEGFSTINDLDRHTKSKHPSEVPSSSSTKKFRCMVTGCKSRDKSWPRLDNFRSHLKRVHGSALSDEGFESMARNGEFWDRATIEFDREIFSPPQQAPPHPAPNAASGSLARLNNDNWRPNIEFVANNTHVLASPNRRFMEIPVDRLFVENPVDRLPIQLEKVTPQETQTQPTVEPLELTSNDQNRNSGISLNSLLLAPVGPTESVSINKDDAIEQEAASQVNKQGSDVSTSAATIKEIVKIVLAITKLKEAAKRPGKQVVDCDELPIGKIGKTATHTPLPGKPTLESDDLLSGEVPTNEDISSTLGTPIDIVDQESPEETALKLGVLKAMDDLGHTLPEKSEDTPQSPKFNAGSVAGNKSENRQTCPLCKKYKGRPCELKKHMKRHSKPYGCTYLTCNKKFGSKNDWKRHENSQHFHQESWRCDEQQAGGGTCIKVCYRRSAFQDHLKEKHKISDEESLKTKTEACRLGRNCQTRFWCGFCVKVIDLKKRGFEAWTERFDHVDDHFEGRHDMPKKDIKDWVPVDSDQPKGEFDYPGLPDSITITEALSGAGTLDPRSSDKPSPKSTSNGESLASAINLDNVEDNQAKKRGHNDDDLDPRLTKTNRKEFDIYCCQCQVVHNPRFEQHCMNCEDAHPFCSNCTVKIISKRE